MGDAMCRQVEVMENDLLVLDAKLPDTAWGVSQGEPGRGARRSHPVSPFYALPTLPAGQAGGGEMLTHEAAAQSRLGDGTVVRMSPKIELVIQVQALELALRVEVGEVRIGWGRAWGGQGMGEWAPGLTWEVPLTGVRLPTIREPCVRLRSSVTVWN